MIARLIEKDYNKYNLIRSDKQKSHFLMSKVAPSNGNDFLFNTVLHHWLIDIPIINPALYIFN
jgi:hypothetical protein